MNNLNNQDGAKIYSILGVNLDGVMYDTINKIINKNFRHFFRLRALTDSDFKTDINIELKLIDVIIFDVSNQNNNILVQFLDFYSYIKKNQESDVPVLIIYDDETIIDKSLYSSIIPFVFFLDKTRNTDFSFFTIFDLLNDLADVLLNDDKSLDIKPNTDNILDNKLAEVYLQIMYSLVSALEAKDPYTSHHSRRVAKYSRLIAEKLNMADELLFILYNAALLHDIGKLGISDDIINKPAKLNDDEYSLIKSHPDIGYGILKNLTDMPWIYEGAKWHHERWDGTGYPDGLKGEDIPLVARIIGIADAYDAMTSFRSYRGCLSQDEVRNEFIKYRGTQFDTDLANLMIELIDEDVNYDLREK